MNFEVNNLSYSYCYINNKQIFQQSIKCEMIFVLTKIVNAIFEMPSLALAFSNTSTTHNNPLTKDLEKPSLKQIQRTVHMINMLIFSIHLQKYNQSNLLSTIQ